MTTVAETYGDEIADRLARWAIDCIVYPPEKIDTYSTRVPATTIRDGREILDDMGFDWRAFKNDQRVRRSEESGQRGQT